MNGFGSDGGFGSLAAAKRGGWLVRIRNLGPKDWVHYGAYVSHPKHGSEFLSDRHDNWSRSDASNAALARINEMMPNVADQPRPHGKGQPQ